MKVIDEILETLPDGTIEEVRVGAFWTAVVAQVEGRRRGGLASTLGTHSLAEAADDHHHGGRPAVADPGRLTERGARELAALAHSDSLLEAGIGFAALNALLPPEPERWVDLNAGEVIAERGAGKRVAVVGHFPFVPKLQERVAQLWVLEQRPRGLDLPAGEAANVIPQADVVALSGTTLLNRTFDGLIALCRPDALVLVLGPTTPLSPVLFRRGVSILSGAVVEDLPMVLAAVSQGANFQQLHRLGVRLVTLAR